jgi:hypothetical protein
MDRPDVIQGNAVSWLQTTENGSGKIIDSENNWYRVAGHSVEWDCLGRVFLEVGEPVLFHAKTKVSKSSGKTYRVALNVKRPNKETGIDPRNWRELCLVRDSNFVVRQLGGLLVVGYDDLSGLRPGDIISCGIERDGNFPTWRATNIRFVAESESEIDWSKEGDYLNV